MPYPFPGMNPYLENPDLWPEIHHRLIVAIANAIETHLSMQYRVAIEKRTYTVNDQESIVIPDVAVTNDMMKKTEFNSFNQIQTQTSVMQSLPKTETEIKPITVKLPVPMIVREGYLEIRDIPYGEVVTVIELISPNNKNTTQGRKAYEKKREIVLKNGVNLVEIDLIRKGKPMSILTKVQRTDYRILVAKGNRLPLGELYTFGVREKIPLFPIPLRREDQEPMLDIQSLLVGVYNQARLDFYLDYEQNPIPPLRKEDGEWMDNLLREQQRRTK